MKNKHKHKIKNSGFKVPQNYFDGLEDATLKQAKLKSLISDSGFKTPENYLENFEVVIKKDSKIISIFSKKNILFVSSIAAALILFFSLNVFDNTQLTIKDLDTTTVDNYILDETEVGDLIPLFQNSELSESHFLDNTLSDVSLESYLFNNFELEDLNLD